MPIYNHLYPTNEKFNGPNTLLVHGPVLQVEISVPGKIAEAIQKSGGSIPDPKQAIALLDTGASMTCVNEDILKSLNLNPIGSSNVSTPGGLVNQLSYPVKIEFIGTPMGVLEFNAVLGCNMKDSSVSALIGRDILCQCLFIMNGPMGCFSLSF